MNLQHKTFKEVPTWNAYYPDLREATSEQREFYSYWLHRFENEDFVDIKGNLSYVFVYLYSIVANFISDKNLDSLLTSIEKLQSGYSKYEKIRDYLTYWKSDAFLYLNDYDKAWETKKGMSLGLSDVINFRSKCKDTSLDGPDLICILGSDSGLTEFGKKYQDQIANLASIFLKDFEKEHEKNMIEYFCRQFNFSNLTDDDLLKLKDFYPDEKDFFFWKAIYVNDEKKKYPYVYAHYLFGGVPTSQPYIECEAIPYIITVALTNEGKRILRECENTLREEKNLPKVGEGWITETELFYGLCDAFPNEKIVHHGRPKWLSPQHLDIYFPSRSIGIEYQGAQHRVPVEYFGGEKAFKKQQKLDRRKSRLCEKYNCNLIYIYETYDFESLKQKIRELLASC